MTSRATDMGFFIIHVRKSNVSLASIDRIVCDTRCLRNIDYNIYMIYFTLSMTSRATDMGFFIFCIQATDPQFKFFPSIITASISTSPSVFKTDPVPVTKYHSYSMEHVIRTPGVA